MALYTEIKTTVDDNIYDNIEELITGEIHNNVLHELIDAVGAAQVYLNPAITDNPGTPENPRAYIALPGVYTNFGGLEVTGPLGVLSWNGSAWSVTQLTIPSGYNYFQCRTTSALSTGTPYTTVNVTMLNGGWTIPVGHWVQIINRRTGAFNFVQLTAAVTGASTSITFKSYTTTSAFPVGSIIEAFPVLNMRTYCEQYVGTGAAYIDLPVNWRNIPVECTDPEVWDEYYDIHVNLLKGTWAASPADDAEYNIGNDGSSVRRRLNFSRVMTPSDLIYVKYKQPTIL